MKKLLGILLVTALVAAVGGCALTDYPVITDDRGDYSGVIRTGHKAYITQTSQVATIWPDGSDELFSMVYQNAYGDQRLYTFNNFDPTATALFLDQNYGYCDWNYEGCEIVRAWNPHQNDDALDYEFFADCSGARSLSLLVAQQNRLGECGDGLFSADVQGLAGEFADLATTTWRGETAYVIPVSAANTSVALDGVVVPLYGQFNGFVTDRLQVMIPMTPNARHELKWLSRWIAENGSSATATISWGSLSTDVQVRFAEQGIHHNADRL